MAERDPNGWGDLEAGRLGTLDGNAFEDFCFDLIKVEVYDRHDDPPALEGPAAASVADGGRDILLTIAKPPRVSRGDYQREHQLHPFTEDALVRTAYSCKSGKGWLTDTLNEIVDRKEPGRAIEVLLEGGYFKLLLNRIETLDEPLKRKVGGGSSSATPKEHLVAALWERMKKEKADAPDPTLQVEILEARTIAGFLQARRPPGGAIARWADRLGIVPLLRGLDEWRAQHREDREEPSFASGPRRDVLRDDLLAFVKNARGDLRDRAAWLVGPPGVGKTRLLLETLSGDSSVAQRVRVAWSPEEAFDAIDRQRLLTRHPDIVLIVDDCPRIQVDAVAFRFLAAAAASVSARVVVVTPASSDAFGDARIGQRWFLDVLEKEVTESLAASLLGKPIDSEEVHEIGLLSEGYPWFATLLAKESLSQGRSPRDLREATLWAIASRFEADKEPDLRALRLRRARCLLAASLTQRTDWDALSPDQEQDVAAAVELERWGDVKDAARECVERGILRRNKGWKFKYVTPMVLEREVIAWLLGPDGPDPGGRTLARRGKAHLSDFFETIERLGLSVTLLSAMATVGLEDLGRAQGDWQALQAAGLIGPRLAFVARHLPGGAARALRGLIEGSTLEQLRARNNERRGLMFALEDLISRREGFEDAEIALFRLAQAENESYANNATSTWASVFLVGLNMTPRSLEERLGLLERRLEEPEPFARTVALSGVQATLATMAIRRAAEPVDGMWPVATPEEARRARVRAWELLARRFADPAETVSSKAKDIAIDELRGAVRAGITCESMAIVANHLTEFTELERVKLRNQLEAIRTYDAKSLPKEEGEYPRRLEDLLAPTSFRQRLYQRVGVWGPAASRSNDEALDDEVARAGLANDRPVLGELDWLASDEAVRAHVFAFALGRCDVQSVLLSDLRRRSREWQTAWKSRILFARYLAGWAEAGRADAADAVVRDLRSDPEEASVLAFAIVELGATEERLGWVEAALRSGQLDPACVLELGARHGWLASVSDVAFASFVGALLEGAPVQHAVAALEILVDRIQQDSSRTAVLRAFLLQALARLAPERLHGMTDYYWELGAGFLVDQGDATRVAELAVTSLSRPIGSNDGAWKALHAAAERDPPAVWKAVTAAIDRRDSSGGRLLISFQFHRSSFGWPQDEVLSWVGSDERRARSVVFLVRPYQEKLDPILRELVLRFGERSSVADAIIARIHSTDGVVSSLAEHDAEQLRHARGWLDDPEAVVRSFAQRLIGSLEGSHETHAASEEDERRRWGT